jgi:hypothetical protein
MKPFVLLITAFWLTAFPLLGHAEDQPPAPQTPPDAGATAPPSKCETGPVAKTFGDAPWLVYSCNDNRTILIIAADGNPAKPFYFSFAPSEGRYHLHGEGVGDREATKAAFEQLKSLSKDDLQALISETKAAKP